MKYTIIKDCDECSYYSYWWGEEFKSNWCEKSKQVKDSKGELFKQCPLKDFPKTIEEYLKEFHNGN